MFSRGVSLEKKIFITSNLRLLLKSGVSIVTAFYFLSKQKYFKEIKEQLEGVAISIRRGNSLSDSLNKYPKTFDKMFVYIMKISESAGKLDSGLETLAKYYQKNAKLKKEITTASLYPSIVLSLIFFIFIFVVFYILPRMLTIFKGFPMELPIQTRILLKMGELVTSGQIFYFVIAFILAIFLYSVLYRISFTFKKFSHGISLRIPMIGNFRKNTLLSLFYNNMSIILKSGLSINLGLKAISENTSNIVFENAIRNINNKVIGGKYLAESMKEENFFFFDDLQVQVIKIGEETGNLYNSFVYLNEFYDSEIRNFISTISNVLEPVLLLMVGGFVLFLALAVLLPILKFIQTLNIS